MPPAGELFVSRGESPFRRKFDQPLRGLVPRSQGALP
jgi:hypothetical protein